MRDAPARVPTVMVVGGYGEVGRRLCRLLARAGGLSLIVAGRRIGEAARVAAPIAAGARRLDLEEPGSWRAACEGVDCVIVCMDQNGVAFVDFLFRHAIDYVDITAGDEFFRAVEGLAPTRSAALLSVGLAPGLTNILAAHGAARLDAAESLDIGLLAGLGDHHGDAGLEWMTRRIFDPARDRRGAPIDFGFGEGRRTAYCVDFSDQHTLRRTLGIGSASTRVCFDSPLATGLLFSFAGAFAGSRLGRSAILAALPLLRGGARMCNVSVHAHGWKDGRRATASAHFAGEAETEITAALAAEQIVRFLDRRRPGVWHTHQIIEARDMIDVIARRGPGRIAVDPLQLQSEPFGASDRVVHGPPPNDA